MTCHTLMLQEYELGPVRPMVWITNTVSVDTKSRLALMDTTRGEEVFAFATMTRGAVLTRRSECATWVVEGRCCCSSGVLTSRVAGITEGISPLDSVNAGSVEALRCIAGVAGTNVTN